MCAWAKQSSAWPPLSEALSVVWERRRTRCQQKTGRWSTGGRRSDTRVSMSRVTLCMLFWEMSRTEVTPRHKKIATTGKPRGICAPRMTCLLLLHLAQALHRRSGKCLPIHYSHSNRNHPFIATRLPLQCLRRWSKHRYPQRLQCTMMTYIPSSMTETFLLTTTTLLRHRHVPCRTKCKPLTLTTICT